MALSLVNKSAVNEVSKLTDYYFVLIDCTVTCNVLRRFRVKLLMLSDPKI